MRRRSYLCILFVAGLVAACASPTPDHTTLSLDEKLAREYQRYETARQLVLSRYKNANAPLEAQMISRAEWEDILAPREADAFATEDMRQLKERQDRRVEAARTAAIHASIIDFSNWRTLPAQISQNRIRDFCQAVPKGGMLHVHPWGSLSRDTFRKLLTRSNPLVSGETLYRNLSNPEGLAYLYPEEAAWLKTLPAQTRFLSLSEADRERIVSMGVLPPGTHPFERFEAVFNFVALVMIGDWDNITAAYNDFAERAVRTGLQYVEFTESISPQDLPKYERLAKRLEQKYGLTVRFNIAYFRTRSVASQNEAAKVMLKKMDAPIVAGIDLLASERNAPALETGQAIYGPVLAANSARQGRWRRTMHAGEHGDVRNTRDALLLGAERIGHGVRLIESPVVMQYAADRKIPIEINLLSNLKLRSVTDIRAHPYLTYLRLGMPVSLSTDDEGIYKTTINNECEVAVGKTDVTYHEFREMAFNSIRTSFAPEDQKQKLLLELERRFNRFEKQQKARHLLY